MQKVEKIEKDLDKRVTRQANQKVKGLLEGMKEKLSSIKQTIKEKI
jgi:hypothetical protein